MLSPLAFIKNKEIMLANCRMRLTACLPLWLVALAIVLAIRATSGSNQTHHVIESKDGAPHER